MRAFLSPQTRRTGTRVDATYSLPLATLSPQEREAECTRLTLQARCTFGTPPPPFAAWFEHDGRLHMPRFYGLDRFGAAEHDDRVDGDSIDIVFVGTPTPVQVRATDAISKHKSRLRVINLVRRGIAKSLEEEFGC